jgi:release factor glutamine methyltransferase
VSSEEITGLDPEVLEWEPRVALEAGPTGLEALAEILNGMEGWLRPGGTAVMEIAPHLAAAATDLARAAGFAVAEVRRDLAGRDRAIVARGAS